MVDKCLQHQPIGMMVDHLILVISHHMVLLLLKFINLPTAHCHQGGLAPPLIWLPLSPLDIEGQLTSVSFDLLSDETNDDNELQPEFNFVHSSNKGNWGWSVSGSFQDRTNREIGTRESNWMTFPDQQATDGYLRVTDAQATVNNNTRADGRTFYQEPSAYQFKDNARAVSYTHLRAH